MFESMSGRSNRRALASEWFGPERGARTYVVSRWLWLRLLGVVFFSAFYSLSFQIQGLIGPRGILPAGEYLATLRATLGLRAFWSAPSLFWIGSSRSACMAVVAAGLLASVCLILNFHPRASILIAGICFLSFVAAARDFSGYQSDGMLLEAAALSFFFAPRGARPRLGLSDPPTRIAHFLLIWEWLRIYFESGIVKLASGETQWRDLTAMDRYYENGPLPTWIGWYVQHLPHGFHAASAATTLIVELFVVWLGFFPRRSRIVAFLLTTPLQLLIILTANYAFLNYLVLFLGVLLLDDGLFRRLGFTLTLPTLDSPPHRVAGTFLTAVFVTSVVMFLFPGFPPAVALGPFRIVNNYGLFAVMTRSRYEIEFQGTRDGSIWTAYPFRYKPQDVLERPVIFAPYQPRFDWNLWFASLGPWQENPMVSRTGQLLLQNDADVLGLFAGNPFPNEPPRFIRSVLWEYWFSSRAEKRTQGVWWRRQFLGTYAPTLARMPDGSIEQVAPPTLVRPPAP